MSQSLFAMQMEFIKGARKIQPIMVNRSKSKEEKREVLSNFVDSLKAETFIAFLPQIMDIINMKEDVCREYADSEAQADGILSWLPRMKEHREILLETIQKRRKKYRLKV